MKGRIHDSDDRYKSPVAALYRRTMAGLLWRAAGWPTALLSPGFILPLIAGGCIFSRYDAAVGKAPPPPPCDRPWGTGDGRGTRPPGPYPRIGLSVLPERSGGMLIGQAAGHGQVADFDVERPWRASARQRGPRRAGSRRRVKP
jgi:hypothetical protein